MALCTWQVVVHCSIVVKILSTNRRRGCEGALLEGVGERAGIRGVFVSGPRPLWLLVRRSRVLALPMRGEGEVRRAS